MSWHRGDWLSFAQAVVSAAAVVTAFVVVFVQQHFHRKQSRQAQKAARRAIESLARRAMTLFERIKNRSLALELNAVSGSSGCLEVEKYRMSIKRRAQAMLATLDLIPLNVLADADCVEAILYLRQGLTELEALFGDCSIENGQPTGPATGRFGLAEHEVRLALQELGSVPKTVIDAAREPPPGNVRVDQVQGASDRSAQFGVDS
ncbi:hypothetical protein ACEPUD_24610 [Burkholderia ubonensis]|uniref:hypothetical protein n=1 Tax=Burkholderia ubonensis TaxID=101571 RepID=UPI00358E2E65